MQGTTISSRTSKPLHSLAESTEQVSADLAERAERISHQAGDVTQRASEWIQENYGKTLGLLGVVALAGTVGYLVGRNNSRLSSEI